MPSFYVTTPIYYVNGEPHLGHAYTTIAADVVARFQRLDGYDVRFLTGTDEHGQKVQQSATAAGVTPIEFADQVAAKFRAMADAVGATYDDFIRTTEPRHTEALQKFWTLLADKGALYSDSYKGWYSVRDEAFYGEDELTTRDDGTRVASSGNPVEWVEEPSWFFKLGEYGDRLLAHYEAHPEFIQPQSRRNEVISFVKQGLKDLSVSRTTFDWGIKVPNDEGHVVYVWLDALFNYVSALGWPPEDARAKEGGLYEKYWPADLHLVGKEIVRFHAIYWPAFLMAANLPLPKRVFGHGWWTVEGQKMSKSLGNAIEPLALIETYGLDQFRYAMLREVPFGNDGDFSKQSVVHRINSDLANGLGNLAQRSLSLVAKNCDGKVPVPGELTAEDQALLNAADNIVPQARAAMGDLAFGKLLESVWSVIGQADQYIDKQAPWALRKTDPARMATVLAVLVQTLRPIGIVLQPFMPGSMARLLDQLGVPADRRDFAHADAKYAVAPGTTLPAPQGLFPRIEADKA
jgi:methionyl-tRNA synthetase